MVCIIIFRIVFRVTVSKCDAFLNRLLRKWSLNMEIKSKKPMWLSIRLIFRLTDTICYALRVWVKHCWFSKISSYLRLNWYAIRIETVCFTRIMFSQISESVLQESDQWEYEYMRAKSAKCKCIGLETISFHCVVFGLDFGFNNSWRNFQN